MALQSSGQISLGDIADEFGVSYSNVSMETMHNLAGFSAPDAMSDFYGYSSVSSFSFTGSFKQSFLSTVCNSSLFLTYYHNNGSGGSSTYPEYNDYIYTTSSMTTKVDAGYYRVSTPSHDWIRVNGFGRVFQVGYCD